MKLNMVTVRWFDGYLEEFAATEVRFGSDLLWMRLENGQNRHIPLSGVRWFGMSQESHQRIMSMPDNRKSDDEPGDVRKAVKLEESEGMLHG